MELIVKSLIAALLVGLLGTVIWIQRDSLKAEQERANRAEQAVADKDGAIQVLIEAARRSKVAVGKLQADKEGIAATLNERERTIESLQYENATIRTWADTSLPDAIVRMRAHGTITGADDYRQRMPASDAVQPAGGGPQD